MDPHPLFRKILYLILCAISVLILLNFLFLINILDRIKLISLLGRFISLDQQIEHPTIILAIIQGEFILGFIALFFVLGMEEISWGQRILNIRTPDFFYFGLLIFAMLLVRHYFVFWEIFEQILAVIGITYSIHIYSRYKKLD